MRENILTYHLKERTNDLNQLESKFGQEEKVLEEEIITLKIHLEEAKRTKEVMKSQILKKKEEVEKLEEEVVTLRSKIVKLKKNVEETKTFVSVVEEKHSMLLENKNEEKSKSYVEILKARNHGQPKSKKTNKGTYSRIPSMLKPQRSLNHDHDQSRNKFRRNMPQRRSFTPSYVNFFYGHIFIIIILDIRLHIAGIIKEMFQQKMPMWPHVTLNVTNFINMDT
jgi:chromosome segregation ATPase